MVDDVEALIDEDEEELDDVGDTPETISWTAASAFTGTLAGVDSNTREFKVGSLNLCSANTPAQAVEDVRRFIEGSEPDVIGIQEAANVWSTLIASFPDWSFQAPTDVKRTPGDKMAEAPRLIGARNIPIMIRRSTCKGLGAGVFSGAEIYGSVPEGADSNVLPIVWTRILHLPTQQTIQVYNNVAPSKDTGAVYGIHTSRMLTHLRKLPEAIKVFAIGGWEINYRLKDEKSPDWPMKALGTANMAANWSYGDFEELPESGIKYPGSSDLPDHIYHRRDDDVTFIDDKLIATTYSDRYGVTATYQMAFVKAAAILPPDDDDDDPAVDRPVERSILTVGTLTLNASMSLANAQKDISDFDDAATGLDIIGLQGMAPKDRDDVMDKELPFILVRANKYPQSRTAIAYRRGRFKRISTDIVGLTDKVHARPGGKPSPQQWATEVVLLDRQSNRFITVWSIHLPPSSKGEGTVAGSRLQIMTDTMEAIAKKARDTRKPDMFLVLGNLNWPASKRRNKQSVPVLLNRADMATSYSTLGANVVTYKGQAMDYVAVVDRSYARWESQGVTTTLLSAHEGLWANLSVKVKPRVSTPAYGGNETNDLTPEPSNGLFKGKYVAKFAYSNIQDSLPQSGVAQTVNEAKVVGDVIGFNEITDATAYQTINNTLGNNWNMFPARSVGDAANDVVGWNLDVFRLASPDIMPPGIPNKDSIFVHRSTQGADGVRYHTRYVNYVALVPTANQNTKPIVFANNHFITHAWCDDPFPDKDWRRTVWNRHFDVIQQLVNRCHQAGISVVVGGDTNRTGFDCWRGMRWTNQDWLDKIAIGRGNNGARFKVLRKGHRDSPSDHDILWLKAEINTG